LAKKPPTPDPIKLQPGENLPSSAQGNISTDKNIQSKSEIDSTRVLAAYKQMLLALFVATLIIITALILLLLPYSLSI
jgi:hypothetical protein